MLVNWGKTVTALSLECDEEEARRNETKYGSGKPAMIKEPVGDGDEMRDEYDFSGGVRGKHYQAYRTGHTVRVVKSDGVVEERHFTLDDGAVMLDPDVKIRFPDSGSVNRALRSLVTRN